MVATVGGGRAEVKYSARYAALINGELKVEDLTTEELSRGRLADRDGKFRGRPPNFLPRQLVEAMKSEHYRRVNAVLEESLCDMVKTMRDIANDQRQDGATRLRAAIYVYERFFGRTPDRIEVSRGDKVDSIVKKIMYDLGESPIEQEIAATEAEMAETPARRRTKQAMTRRNR